jgi:general secretion pathway protein K
MLLIPFRGASGMTGGRSASGRRIGVSSSAQGIVGPLSLSPASDRKAQVDNGFALMIVLWWLVLLALLLTQITAAARTEVMIAANIRGSTVAEAAADGAVNEAIFQVLSRRWQVDGSPHLIRGVQAVAEVRIDDEGQKIDPNVTPVILMAALLRGCGATPTTAERIALAISEWRSLDVLRTATSESASQYPVAGLGYLPPHKRFVSKDELGLVRGMTPELLGCLSPHISIYSLSVPSLAIVDDQVIRQAIIEAYPDDAAHAVAAPVREVAVIRVSAAARATAGGKFLRVAVVRIASLSTSEDFAYRILSWEGDTPE